MRISGLSGSRHLTHCRCLTKVHFRLGDRFGSSFLQIPHWLCNTVSPPWVAIPSFFGHPCLHLHFPFSLGNGWTFTSLLTTMPVAHAPPVGWHILRASRIISPPNRNGAEKCRRRKCGKGRLRFTHKHKGNSQPNIVKHKLNVGL